MESDTKVERNISVLETVEDRLNPDHAMRILTAIWLVPAIALLGLGLSAVLDLAFLEGSFVSESNRAQRLHEVRAAVTLLSIFTVLGGAIWALRSWDLLPSLRSIRDDNWLFGLRFHCLALAVATGAVIVAPFAEGLATGANLILLWTAAVAACVGGALLPRWLRQIGQYSSQSMALFAGVIVYQLTIGWLHMFAWTTAGSVILVAEGMTMAIVSVVATVGVPGFGRRHLRIAEVPVVHETRAESTVPEEVVPPMPEEALRPAEEPAAVH